ncbi:MAG: hypothetical protein LBJ17_00745 [Dysgonamonadaceae bacterium]|jgi:hypothetical protein|nr:hypothetical protein [Dysgonamonadaceae bacterium]
MRAKEYIEMNKSSIQYLDDIKRVVADLMLLRKDKEATDKYYNDYLLSDWRFSVFQKELHSFQLDTNNQLQEPVLEKFDGEIPHTEAPAFRCQLFEVIKADASFGYLFYQLGVEKNKKSAFHKSKPIQCVPDDNAIVRAIQRYRDDYPKKSLDEFLDDNFNYEQYSFLTENNIFSEDTANLLLYFNTTHLIYDKIRCLKNKLSEVNLYCKQFEFSNEVYKYWVFSFIIQMIDEFEKQDKQLERCKNEVYKIIRPIEEMLYPNELGLETQDNADTDFSQRTFKVTTDVMMLLLKKSGICSTSDDKAKMARLISYLTGFSVERIRQRLSNTDELTSRHKDEVDTVNKILKDLNFDVSIRYNKKR